MIVEEYALLMIGHDLHRVIPLQSLKASHLLRSLLD